MTIFVVGISNRLHSGGVIRSSRSILHHDMLIERDLVRSENLLFSIRIAMLQRVSFAPILRHSLTLAASTAAMVTLSAIIGATTGSGTIFASTYCFKLHFLFL